LSSGNVILSCWTMPLPDLSYLPDTDLFWRPAKKVHPFAAPSVLCGVG
jgi:hypothetical protein